MKAAKNQMTEWFFFYNIIILLYYTKYIKSQELP